MWSRVSEAVLKVPRVKREAADAVKLDFLLFDFAFVVEVIEVRQWHDD